MEIKAVFLDREGVITPKLGKGEFLLKPEQAVVADGAVRGLAELARLGVKLFIVTNQSCVSRGMISAQKAWDLHGMILAKMTEAGVNIEDSRICTHTDDDGCSCRKPKPGMILDICAKYGIEPEESIMIGDSERDIVAGKMAGCFACVYIGDGSCPDSVTCKNLTDAADHIIKTYYAD